MNPYFQQLDFDVPEFTVEQLKGSLYADYASLKYYHIADPSVEQTLKSICPINNVSISYIEISGTLLPHIDSDGTVVINYYINGASASTVFYEPSNKKSKEFQGAQVYPFNNCIEQCKFIANNHSAYLLNVSKIHSVIMSKKETRTAISFSFPQRSYTDIVDELKWWKR
jgi:hypothetical protein